MLTAPRSGSSMVAGLLALHGIWAGTSDDADIAWNPKGYFENAAIKACLRRHYGLPPNLLKDREEPEATDAFLAELPVVMADDGHAGGPWLFKTGVLYHRLFEPLRPRIVTVRRQPEAMLASYVKAHPGTAWKAAEDAIAHRVGLLDRIEQDGAWRVDSDRVIAGDLRQVEDVLSSLNIGLDPVVANAWIDTSLWHYK